MELASVEDCGPGPAVGDGDLPQELDHLNWGALLLGILWALFYAPWPWFFILAGARVALSTLNVYIYGSLLGQGAQIAFTLAYVGVYWALVVVFAFRANSLAWRAERNRVARQSDQSVPRPARPVSKYLSSQRNWVIGGIVFHVLMWLNILRVSGVALNGAATTSDQRVVIVIDVAVILSLFVIERVRRLRSAS